MAKVIQTKVQQVGIRKEYEGKTVLSKSEAGAYTPADFNIYSDRNLEIRKEMARGRDLRQG